MFAIYQLALATPATMDPDAYRELCWGADLDRTEAGYGLALAADDRSGDMVTAVFEDTDYVRLLMDAHGVKVPADKVSVFLTGWPDLNPQAPTVWP
ncbi:hypothetical protein ACFU99_17625 [Streptomyces sp. NPDC057654]|uniref:hypothetical protein n=1 Tax=Streptomyces sp. NPDC057654 TaxID=3346196 RepID=UPI0036B12E4C